MRKIKHGIIKSTLSIPFCQNRNKRHLRNYRPAATNAIYNMWRRANPVFTGDKK